MFNRKAIREQLYSVANINSDISTIRQVCSSVRREKSPGVSTEWASWLQRNIMFVKESSLVDRLTGHEIRVSGEFISFSLLASLTRRVTI